MGGNSQKEEHRKPVFFEKPWALALGACVGIVTLVFLMALVIAAINGKSPPASAQYIIYAIISFGLAYATAFLGGRAAIQGELPFIPEGNAVEFSMVGGVAVFVIVFVVMSKFSPGFIDKEDWSGEMSSLKSAVVKVFDVDDRMIVKVNDSVLVDANYGSSGSFDFKDKLVVGKNTIGVSVINGRYGGCSGFFQISINGRVYDNFERGVKNNFAEANQVCKSWEIDFPVK